MRKQTDGPARTGKATGARALQSPPQQPPSRRPETVKQKARNRAIAFCNRAKKALAAGAALACLAAPAIAEGVDIPQFWDAKERLPNPNLAQLQRLRFLTTTDFPPFNFLDGDGRLTGFHVDLARAICAKLEIANRCEIQALPWADLQGALEKGEGAAILAGVSITPESRRSFAFSRPYMMFPARFVMPGGGAEPIHAKVQGQRIGVIAGSAHERMLRAYFGGVKPVTNSNPEWMYKDLRAGRLAGLFGDGMRLSFWLGSPDSGNCCAFAGGPYMSHDYLGQGLAIAVRPQDTQLKQAFDHALQALAADGRMAELYLRYFPIGFY